MLDAQLSQLLDVAEQLAIDVVFVVFRHSGAIQANAAARRGSSGSMPSGSLAKRPSGRHGTPGLVEVRTGGSGEASAGARATRAGRHPSATARAGSLPAPRRHRPRTRSHRFAQGAAGELVAVRVRQHRMAAGRADDGNGVRPAPASPAAHSPGSRDRGSGRRPPAPCRQPRLRRVRAPRACAWARVRPAERAPQFTVGQSRHAPQLLPDGFDALRRRMATMPRQVIDQRRMRSVDAETHHVDLLPAPAAGDLDARDEPDAGVAAGRGAPRHGPPSMSWSVSASTCTPRCAAAATSAAGASVPSEKWLWVCRSMRSVHGRVSYGDHARQLRTSRSHRHAAARSRRHAARSRLRYPFLARSGAGVLRASPRPHRQPEALDAGNHAAAARCRRHAQLVLPRLLVAGARTRSVGRSSRSTTNASPGCRARRISCAGSAQRDAASCSPPIRIRRRCASRTRKWACGRSSTRCTARTSSARRRNIRSSGSGSAPQVPYDPARTAFIDDNPKVLEAARRAGIDCVIAVTHAGFEPATTRTAAPASRTWAQSPRSRSG